MQAADLSCTDIDPAIIPQAMRDRPQWVLWRAEFSPQKSKYTKIPLNPHTGGFASTNRPATWAPFDVALAALRAGTWPASGLGFVFTADDPFTGVDLDHCVEHGVLSDLARAVVRELGSYAELSPSGTGVHVICEATLPGPGLHRPTIELYDRGRYFTVSARPIGSPLPIARAQTAIDALYREHAGEADLPATATERSPPPSCPPDTPLPAWPSAITEALVCRGEGLADYGNDHSRAAFQTARTLLERGWSAAQVLLVLTDPDHYLAQQCGLKRRGTVEGARAWTWQYVVQPALASVQPTDLSLFQPITHEQAAVVDISNPSPGASTPSAPSTEIEQHNPTNPLRLHPLAQFAGDPIPEREWVWQDYLPRQEVTALYGSGGLGKSFLSLQLATAITTGTPFLGFDVARGAVIGLYCEDDLHEIRRRIHAIHRSNIPDFGFDLTAFESTLTDLLVSSRRGLPNELATFTPAGLIQPTPLYHALLDHAKTIRPALIVLDSLYDLFLGDANEQSPVRQFMALLTALADRSGAAVLLLAHPSKSGESTGRGDSGSVAWHAAVRSRLYLAQPTELEERRQHPNRRLLSRKKGNYSSDPSEGEMLLESRDGPFALITLGAPGSTHPAYESHAHEIDLLIEAVRNAGFDSRTLSPDPRASDFVVNDALGLAGLRRGVHATTKDRLKTALSIALAAKFLTRVTSTHPDTGKTRTALTLGTAPSLPPRTSGISDPLGEVSVEDWEL